MHVFIYKLYKPLDQNQSSFVFFFLMCHFRSEKRKEGDGHIVLRKYHHIYFTSSFHSHMVEQYTNIQYKTLIKRSHIRRTIDEKVNNGINALRLHKLLHFQAPHQLTTPGCDLPPRDTGLENQNDAV